MSYQIDKRLNELTVRELPLNRREQLSSYLNTEQVLMSECGLARDYRGLAQQLDLSYSEISQLDKLCDPCGSLLSYQRVSKLTVFELFELLVCIGRYDILDDMIPLILHELAILNSNRNKNPETRLVTTEQSTIWYDAYVCYADSDLDFVQRLAEYLESPEIGFRLFIRDRDLLVGNWVYETFARLIETQCRRMIIVLSPDFFQSHDCKFQSLFATGLAIEKCQRILVPIIYKPCNQIPSMLRLMSKIDLSSSARNIPEWSMKRLVMSIQQEPSYSKQTNHAMDFNKNQSNKNQNNSNNNQSQTPELISLHSINSNSNETNVSVISSIGTENDNDFTKLSIHIDPPISNSSSTLTSLGVNNTQYSNADTRNSNEKSNNRSKNWIKTIKKKFKVAL